MLKYNATKVSCTGLNCDGFPFCPHIWAGVQTKLQEATLVKAGKNPGCLHFFMFLFVFSVMTFMYLLYLSEMEAASLQVLFSIIDGLDRTL